MNPSINKRSRTYRGLFAGVAIASLSALSLTALAAADTKGIVDAPAATPSSQANWNFERGDLTHWGMRVSGSGAWHVYADGTKPPDPGETDPMFAFRVPQPPEGRFAAVTDMTAPGSRILLRDVKLDGRMKLRFTLFYENHVGSFASPRTFDHKLRRPNQQLRVDLVKPSARVDSLAAKDVLATIFATKPGDAAKLDPRTVTFDLSRWAQKTVRLRFAQVDNTGPMRAGVDDVRFERIGR